MFRTSSLVAALAALALVAACGPSSTETPVQQDAGGADRLAQHDGAQDGPAQDDATTGDGPQQGDAIQQQDANQQDAGPATLYADIRYLQQDPALSGLAPINGRVRIEGAIVTAVKDNVNRFFIQNATGPKEYSGIMVKRNAIVPTVLAIGDIVTAIEGTLIEETVFCDGDGGVCPTRHAIANVTLFTKGATGSVPAPQGVTGTEILAAPAKYDGLLVQLTDSTLTVASGGTATTTPLSNGMAAYGTFYSPPAVVPTGTVVLTCIGAIDIYNRTWEIYPRSNADLIFQDWPGDAGVQTDASTTQDATSTSDAAPCTDAVVISQVYGGGGNTGAPYTNDFVELFNRGAGTVDLSAWSVQYASYNGVSWTAIPLTGRSIVTGGYLLVQLGSGGSAGVALPTADVTNSLNISATHGKLALVNNQTALTGTCPLPSANIIDFVGYGTDATCQEGTLAPAGSNTTSITRKAAGCQDYNDNGYDFSAVAPAPRHSLTTAAPCGC